ncbi:MAG: CAP domain-containing protein [Rubrivivax sp.]|nr:MAG: CAP domain-containing protein [Rubrivivax sp.]
MWHAAPMSSCSTVIHATRALQLTVLLSLAGCGGGGSSDMGAPPNPAPAPTPPPATAGTRVTCNLPNFEAEMLAAVNARRRMGATCGAQGAFAPAPELSWNMQLTQAAVAHSDDMVSRNFFSHTGSDGSTVGTRATTAGYSWRSVGENIAAGQGTVAEVMDGWMKSDGHCANLMNPGFRDLGAACVAGTANNSYRSYWSQEFGTPR